MKYILFIILAALMLFNVIQIVLAQSVVWDEKTKSWISTSAAAPTAPTTTTPQPQQIPQTQIPPQTFVQTVPTVTPGASTVDMGTLMTIITPILAGISGMFIKNRKDIEKSKEEIEKSKEEVKKDTIKAIEQAIELKLKQIIPVAEQTAKQDVKINQLAIELYKLMADKADQIQDKPEIQQKKLMEDVVKSQVVAEKVKEASSVVWDENTKSWVSK